MLASCCVVVICLVRLRVIRDVIIGVLRVALIVVRLVDVGVDGRSDLGDWLFLDHWLAFSSSSSCGIFGGGGGEWWWW